MFKTGDRVRLKAYAEPRVIAWAPASSVGHYPVGVYHVSLQEWGEHGPLSMFNSEKYLSLKLCSSTELIPYDPNRPH